MSDKSKAEQDLRDLGQILDLLEVVFRNGTEQNLGMSRGGVIQNIERCRELLTSAVTGLGSQDSAVVKASTEEPTKMVRQLNIQTLMEKAGDDEGTEEAVEKVKEGGIASRIRILPRVRMFDD